MSMPLTLDEISHALYWVCVLSTLAWLLFGQHAPSPSKLTEEQSTSDTETGEEENEDRPDTPDRPSAPPQS